MSVEKIYKCDLSGEFIPQDAEVTVELHVGDDAYITFDLSPNSSAKLIRRLFDILQDQGQIVGVKTVLREIGIKFKELS